MSGKQFYIDNSNIEKLQYALVQAEAVVIGAGAGLSASAGFTYNGERFHKYFGDFEKNMDFKICILVVSIHSGYWKNTGLTGAGISILTGIWMRQSQFTRNYLNL